MNKNLGEQLTGVMPPETAIANMRTLVAECDRLKSAQSAEGVCRGSRDIWNAFEEQLVFGNPDRMLRAKAKKASQLLGRGVRAIEAVLASAKLSPVERERLPHYAAAVQKRMEDLEVLAEEGPAALNARLYREFFKITKNF